MKTTLPTPSDSPITLLRAVLRFTPKRKQWQIALLLLSQVANIFLETLAFGSVALYIATLATPQTLLNSATFQKFTHLFGLQFLADQNNLTIALGVVVVMLIVGHNFVRAINTYCLPRIMGAIDSFFAQSLIRGYLTMPYQWFTGKTTADLIQGVNWTTFLGTQFLAQWMQAIVDILFNITLLGIIILAQPVVGLCLLFVSGTISATLFFIFKKKIDMHAKRTHQFKIDMHRHRTRSIYGAKEIRLFALEEDAATNYFATSLQDVRAKASLALSITYPTALLQIIGVASFIATITVMLTSMNEPSENVFGYAMLIAVVSWRSIPAIIRIVNSIAGIRKAMPYVYWLISLLNEMRTEIGDVFSRPIKETKPTTINSTLELKSIDFAYQPNENILKDLSITLNKNTSLGIIGQSGAGKSTLVDILSGLYLPTRGDILLDGKPMTPALSRAWRHSIGYVPQSPYIYDGTLSENIAFCIPIKDIDRDKVLQCCKMAAIDFLEDLPEGIDTQIGERATRLSGGQSQRVAIARALYREPDLLIFDEATSSLDSANEQLIQNTIKKIMHEKTVVIIAHRLSTVTNCDVVAWLKDGRIHKIGSPHEVLKEYEALQDERSE